MSIVWIASYPKSGNTWVRFLLYSAIYGPPERSIEISERIQDIHRPTQTTPEPEGPELIKTHFILRDDHPRIDESIGAIHIVRNPRDVLLSALHYHKMTKRRILGVSDKKFATTFIRRGGNPEWIGPFGTWAQHADAWSKTDRFPVLPVKYEDLKSDPKAQLKRMLGFLEIDRSDNAIDRAVDASSFDAMRSLEVREKSSDPSGSSEGRPFVGTPSATKKGRFFINKGATGQRLNTIAKGLDDAFDRAFGDAMAHYGYPTQSPV